MLIRLRRPSRLTRTFPMARRSCRKLLQGARPTNELLHVDMRETCSRAPGGGLRAWRAGCGGVSQRSETPTAQRQVMETERAFAKTMADRDFSAFSSFIAPDAVFFTGPEARRGKQAVVDAWKRFYEKPDAPFSWRPETVEVLDSGSLALSKRPGVQSRRQAVRHLHVDLAPGRRRNLAHRVRQGQPGVRLREGALS